MGSGIAGKRRLPRQMHAGKDSSDDASTSVDERMPTQSLSGLSTDLVSPQPLSYEERRDRWLRNTGGLWKPDPESVESQRI